MGNVGHGAAFDRLLDDVWEKILDRATVTTRSVSRTNVRQRAHARLCLACPLFRKLLANPKHIEWDFRQGNQVFAFSEHCRSIGFAQVSSLSLIHYLGSEVQGDMIEGVFRVTYEAVERALGTLRAFSLHQCGNALGNEEAYKLQKKAHEEGYAYQYWPTLFELLRKVAHLQELSVQSWSTCLIMVLPPKVKEWEGCFGKLESLVLRNCQVELTFEEFLGQMPVLRAILFVDVKIRACEENEKLYGLAYDKLLLGGDVLEHDARCDIDFASFPAAEYIQRYFSMWRVLSKRERVKKLILTGSCFLQARSTVASFCVDQGIPTVVLSEGPGCRCDIYKVDGAKLIRVE